MSNLKPEDTAMPSGSDSTDTLPVKKGDDFVGEFETMDLNPIKGENFFIGVSTGDREKGKMLSTTIKGPFNFYEMLEEVGIMWKDHMHHSAVYIASKERDKKNKHLDRNTIDYIEANWENLITEGLLAGAFDEDQDVDYTCTVGINEADTEDDPRFAEEESDASE